MVALLHALLLQNRGSSFAVCNGVLLGTLLELLVVRGGPQGTLDAVSIVDSCRAKGVPCADMPPRVSTAAHPRPSTWPTMAAPCLPSRLCICQLHAVMNAF